MAIDPRKLRPGELVRLLNSTPLGEVTGESMLRRHRTRAGFRIGEGKHVDLVRYVAWLVLERHAPQTERKKDAAGDELDLVEAAEGAATLAGGDASRCEQMRGHGQKLTAKQEAVIAALLTEPTHAAAAAKAGICEATLYRWLKKPDFRTAYRQARRELVETAVGRIQAASGQAVETLLHVARHGKRESDRVRAAALLLEHALRGLAEADTLHGSHETNGAPSDLEAMGTSEVVRILAERLRQLDTSELSTTEKSRLSVSLAQALLRAITVDVLDGRLEALQAVLLDRKNAERKDHK